MRASRRGFENEPPDRDPTKLGLSGSGHCARQLAYKFRGVAAKRLPWKALCIFSDGNYIQDQIRQWLHLYPPADCFYLADEETEVSLTTPKGREVRGHVDGVLHHRADLNGVSNCNDPSHRTRLLEIKSMGRRGYERLSAKAKSGGIEKSYQTQISCYLRALGLDECVFLAKCKDTSELFEYVYTRDDSLVDEALRRYDEVFDNEDPNSVQRMYQPSDRGWLPWQCGYCPYVAVCWEKYLPREAREHMWVLDGDYNEATETT